MERVNQMFNKKMQEQNNKTNRIVEQLRKNGEKNKQREDFEQKDFEEKTNDKFELKHRISTDVNEEENYKVKEQYAESDGEDF